MKNNNEFIFEYFVKVVMSIGFICSLIVIIYIGISNPVGFKCGYMSMYEEKCEEWSDQKFINKIKGGTND